MGSPQTRRHTQKDAVDRAIVRGDRAGALDGRHGHQGGPPLPVRPGRTRESVRVRLRLMAAPIVDRPFQSAPAVVADRRVDADAFYDVVIPAEVPDEDRLVARRAFAGLLLDPAALPL